jgi:hypothetical protein
MFFKSNKLLKHIQTRFQQEKQTEMRVSEFLKVWLISRHFKKWTPLSTEEF